MHPQLQLLVALQDLDEMINETANQGTELEGLGFKHGGLEELKKSREDLATKIGTFSHESSRQNVLRSTSEIPSAGSLQ